MKKISDIRERLAEARNVSTTEAPAYKDGVEDGFRFAYKEIAERIESFLYSGNALDSLSFLEGLLTELYDKDDRNENKKVNETGEQSLV